LPVKSSTGIGKTHLGFKESVDDIWSDVVDLAHDYGKTRTVWCAGHSLGAAMATILAYRLQRADNLPSPQALFTYGSPRCGDKEYIQGHGSYWIISISFC
jgi:triacylglycerol lipase